MLSFSLSRRRYFSIPPYQVFRLLTQVNIIGEEEIMGPMHDLLVRFVRRVRTERRVANQTFEHDRPEGPPIAFVSIAFLKEYFWCNVVGCSDRRISLQDCLDPLSPDRESDSHTSFRRFAFHVAIWSLFVMVRLIELTITLFLAAWVVVGA